LLRSSRCLPFCCLQLKELKEELAGLRVAKVTGGAPNKLSKM
jgi:ribosomal protein L29